MEQELDEELQFHLQNQIAKNVQAGMSLEEARCAALREFGGVEQVKETCRDLRTARYIEEFYQDLKHAFRFFRRNSGFSTTVVLILALGIGATTAVFSVVNAVLFRPLPFPHADRLMAVQSTDPDKKSAYTSAPGVFIDWRERSTSFEHLAGVSRRRMTLGRPEQPRQITALQCSHDFFEVLGLRPVLGRTFAEDEDQLGRGDMALVDAGWRCSS